MSSNKELARILALSVGKRLRKARSDQAITQARLAAALDLSRTTLSNIECGRQRLFLDQAYEAAFHLSVDVQTLLPPLHEIAPIPRIRTPADGSLPAMEQGRLSRALDAVLEQAAASSIPQLIREEKTHRRKPR